MSEYLRDAEYSENFEYLRIEGQIVALFPKHGEMVPSKCTQLRSSGVLFMPESWFSWNKQVPATTSYCPKEVLCLDSPRSATHHTSELSYEHVIHVKEGNSESFRLSPRNTTNLRNQNALDITESEIEGQRDAHFDAVLHPRQRIQTFADIPAGDWTMRARRL